MDKLLKLDWVLLTSVILLLLIGFLALYSISYDGSVFNGFHLGRQAISMVIGFAALLFLAFFDYRVFNSWSTKLYFIALILLVAVFFFGVSVRGTTGWLGFSNFRIQPVEITKLIMIIFLASFLSKKKNQLSILVRIIASIVLIFIPVFLILKQPDFGSASIIVGGWAVLLSYSGLNKKNFLILAAILILSVSSSWLYLADYQKERIANFISPGRDPRGSGYNVIQSVVAVGSGSLMGKGLGHGSQSQLNFLPEKRTDFIFAVIAEELGFLGVAAIFVLFGIIFWRLKETARLARDNFGYLITLGVMAMIFFQLLINVGMNTGVMPVAGVPLPFLSYGGSSLVTTLIAIGLIQSIYIRRIKA